jgi:hypothetical protein
MTTVPTFPDVVYVGHTCACVRAGSMVPARFEVLTRDGRLVGQIRWHQRWRVYSFVPEPGTAWDSGTLSEIGVWIRRLNRQS